MPNSLITISEADVGEVPLDAEVNHVVGTTATTLTRPANAKFLVLAADKNAFRLRKGAGASMPAQALPAASVTDGTGALYLPEGKTVTLPVFDTTAVTVKGYDAGSVLTYYWR
jgi:hypothetical protein